MADINVYNTQVVPDGGIGTRRASASDFGADSAAGLGVAARGLESAGQEWYSHQQEQEVSDVHVKLAQARSKLTVELANRAETGDLTSPDFADKFMQDVQNELDASGADYGTQGARRAFQEGSASIASTMMSTAGVYQAQAVGAKVKQDYASFVDANQNTLLRDPGQLDDILKGSLNALNDPAGPYARLPRGSRDELARTTKEQLAKSAVLGSIRMDPEGTKKALEDGAYSDMLKGEDSITLMNQADVAIQGKMVEEARLEAAQRRALEDSQRKTGDDFIRKLTESTTGLSTSEVVDSNLDWREKVTFINFIKKGLDGTRDDSNSGFTSLFMRVHADPGDPNRITDEKELYQFVDNGALSIPGLNQLRSELSGSKTVEGSIEGQMKKQFLESQKQAITGTNEMLGMKDPKGEENYLRFMTQFLSDYEKQTQAGKTPAQLLDPDSPDYLGKAAKQFVRSPQQMMKDIIEGGGSPLSPDAGTPGAAVATKDIPTPTSKAEYDALPSGSQYIKNGVTKVKP